MNLKDDKQQNIQIELDFSLVSDKTGEKQRAGGSTGDGERHAIHHGRTQAQGE